MGRFQCDKCLVKARIPLFEQIFRIRNSALVLHINSERLDLRFGVLTYIEVDVEKRDKLLYLMDPVEHNYALQTGIMRGRYSTADADLVTL